MRHLLVKSEPNLRSHPVEVKAVVAPEEQGRSNADGIRSAILDFARMRFLSLQCHIDLCPFVVRCTLVVVRQTPAFLERRVHG